MGTNYIAPIWRMPRNFNKDNLSSYSINFNGTDYISIVKPALENNILSGLEEFSISVWYNANSLTNDRAILGAWSSGVTQMLLYWDDNNDIPPTGVGWRFLMSNGTTSSDVVWGRATTTNEWHHIVVTYDGSTISFYHDNGDPETDSGIGPVNNSTSAWRIGVDTSSTRYWDGKLSQFCLFDYALTDGTIPGTPNQIEYLYNLNNPMVPGTVNLTAPIFYNQLGDNSNPNANVGYPNISTGTDSVFLFNGQNIDVPDSDLLSFGDSFNDSPFTMSAWIKSPNSGGKGIMSKFGSTGHEWLLWTVGSGAAKVRMNLYDGGATVYQTTQGNTSVDTNEWFHVVATYDGRGGNTAGQGIKIYVNGEEDIPYSYLNSTGAYTAMHNTAREVQIGAYSGAGQWTGEMSNCQIWGRVLTDPEVKTLYNNGQPLITGTQPREADLKAWYKLNQSANWEADTAGNWQIPNAVSPYPHSFNFIGNDYINLGNPTGLQITGAITLSLWFNSSAVTGGLITKSQGGGYFGTTPFKVWELGILSSVLYWQISDGTNKSECSFNVSSYLDNKWHHIMATWDGTTNVNSIKLFVDSVEVDSEQSVISATQSNTNNVVMSSASPTYDYDGKLSNVAIWDSDQSSEISNIYNSGTPATSYTNTPSAWYKLDNTATFSTDWTIPDASGNGNTGTSTGMTEQSLVRNNVSILNGESSGMTTIALVQSNLTRTQPFSNYSMFYDSVDVYSTFDTQISIAASDSFTWSFWIKPVYTTYSDMVLVRSRPTSLTANNTMLLTNSGGSSGNWRLKWDLPGSSFDTGYVIPNNEWSHVALSMTQGTGTRYGYVNGVQVKSDSAAAGISDVWLGFSTENAGNDFEGYLSQCAYWDTNLSTTELAALYNNGVPQDLRNFTVPPTQYWPMNEDYSYWDGSVWINRDIIANNDSTTVNTVVVGSLVGNAPGSDANGEGNNLAIANLIGDMKDSKLNAFSINMADYADGVTNPANSGRSTDTP